MPGTSTPVPTTTGGPGAKDVTYTTENCDKTGTCYDGMFIMYNRVGQTLLFKIIFDY